MNYKITNGRLLVRRDDAYEVIREDLFIRDNIISFTPFGAGESFETVDAEDHLVMPGLINMHTHAYMTLMRNYADDVPFHRWLFDGVMPVEDSLDPEAAYWTSLLDFTEMIRTGTTCFMHMYCRHSPKAAKEAGMRAFIGRGLVGEDLYKDGAKRFQEALDEKEEYESDLIRFVLSPHAIYSCSDLLLSQVEQESKKRGMLKQIHLSESVKEVEDCLAAKGKTPVALLDDLGFLDENTILAHCVQMRGDDLERIKKSGASIVTNPASNAKLGNGFAPAVKMMDMGINLCIGTDGAASNNTLNMFREMSLLSLLQKGLHSDPTAMSADKVIKAATENAAAALGMSGKLGVIREGALADLIFIDLNEPSLFPDNNIPTSLCYSANGTEVSSVMINGRFVMKDRQMLTIDVKNVYEHVRRAAQNHLKTDGRKR